MPASQENGKESLLFVAADGTVMHWRYTQPSAPVTPFIPPSVYNGADLQDITLTALAVSPSGEQLLLATSNGDVQARDASTGNLVYFYQGHSAQVNDIEWTPDGQHIVTASQDRTVQIWQEP
jgi:WD40 repeat protein